MKKTWLPFSLGLLLALLSCGGTGASSSSSVLSSTEGSSSLGEGGSSSSEVSSSSRPDSSSDGSSSSSSEPLGAEKAIDLTGESDEYASRPGAGLLGDFSLMEIIGTDIYYLSASSSRSEEGSILLMEEGALFQNATDLVNISSFRLVYELSAGAEASLAFGDGESDFVSFELPSSGAIDIEAGSDFGPGYSHFRLLLSSGTLALREVHISFKEEEEPFNVSLSMSLLAERADIGTRLSDLLAGVHLETSEHRSLLLESGYEAVGTLSVYVYDFDNPPSAEAVLPSVDSLSLYPGESYSFSPAQNCTELQMDVLYETDSDSAERQIDLLPYLPYVNAEYGFTLTLPRSWRGQVELLENDPNLHDVTCAASFYMRDAGEQDYAGWLVGIYRCTSQEWEETEAAGNPYALPVLAEAGGYVFYAAGPTDLPVDESIPGALERYTQLSAQISELLESFTLTA